MREVGRWAKVYDGAQSGKDRNIAAAIQIRGFCGPIEHLKETINWVPTDFCQSYRNAVQVSRAGAALKSAEYQTTQTTDSRRRSALYFWRM